MNQNELRWIDRALREATALEPGTKMLIAVDGFSEPGHECTVGELLVPPATCGRDDCTCGDHFNGVTTDGTASVGRVTVFRGAPRVLLEMEIATVMSRRGGFDDPDRSAAAFLDEVAQIDEGRLVRREENLLLPFPKAARITGPHSIEYRLTDEP